MNAKRTLLILLTTFLLSLSVAFVLAQENQAGIFVLGVNGGAINATIRSYYPLNNTIVRGNVTWNVTLNSTTLGGFGGNNATSNISAINLTLVNFQTSAVFAVLGNSTTGNTTSFTASNSTVGIPDGIYLMNLTLTNANTAPGGGAGVASIVLGNITIDNTPPNLQLNVFPVANQTNNTLLFNLSVSDWNTTLYGKLAIPSTVGSTAPGNHTLFNCSLFVDQTHVNTTTINTAPGAQLLNAAGNSTTNLTLTFGATELRDQTAFIACTDTARQDGQFGIQGGNRNVTPTVTFTVDVNGPVLTITFKDDEGNEKTEFQFGQRITAECNMSDAVTGVDPRMVNITLARPGEAPANKTGDATITRTRAEFVIPSTETRLVGEYLFSCSTADFADKTGFGPRHTNATNKTFTIIPKAPSPGAYAVPGFKEPLANKVIGVGVVNNLGELGVEGEARLIAETGGIIVTINGEEYTITVKEVTDDAATLTIGDFESTLNAGDTRQYDLNEDQTNDLEITLNMIFKQKADLIFKRVEVQAAPPTPPPPTPTGGEQPPAAPEKKVKVKSIISVAFFLIIIVALIFLALHFIRKRGQGESKVRFTPKDLGGRRDATEDFYSQITSRSGGEPPPGQQPPPFSF